MRQRVIFAYCVILHAFSCLLVIYQINNCENYLRKTVRMSNSLNLEQNQHFVWPDLGQHCLQRLSADNKKLPLQDFS